MPILLDVSESGRPSPAAEVAAARRLIRYDNISLMEPQFLFIETIQKSVPEDSFIVWDITQLGYYARTHYKVSHPKTYIDSGYSFNLGYAFPTALGAKVAKPERPVLCMVGDGGFMFNASELSTAVNYGINVVTVVFRNDSYGNVGAGHEEGVWRGLWDGFAEPGLRAVCRILRGGGHSGQQSVGVGEPDSRGAGDGSAGGNRRADGGYSDAEGAADSAVLFAAVDDAAGGVDFFVGFGGV